MILQNRSLKRSDSRRTFEEAMGVQAALFQQPFGANPYRRPTERWSRWRAGWSSIMHSRAKFRTIAWSHGDFIKCENCNKEFWCQFNKLHERRFCSMDCRAAGGWREPRR